MFLRRMKRIHHGAQEQLRVLQEKHRALEESLIGVLGQVLHQAQEDASDAVLGQRVRQLLAAQGGPELLEQQYESVSAYHQDNYLPLLWPLHVRHRTLLFRVLELLHLESATQDTDLLEALNFVRRYRHAHRDTVPFELDLRFASPRWLSVIQRREQGELVLQRRALEVCVFTHLALALQNGDLYVVGAQTYADYRCRFFLHGWRHVSEAARQRLQSVQKGDSLRVALELNNPATKLALQLQTVDYHMIGWTPRYLVADLSEAIETSSEKIQASIVKINPAPAPSQQRVLAEMSGNWPPDYEPMSSEDFQDINP